MITAGVDAGLRNIKILILDGGKIAAKGIAPSGGAGRAKAIEKLWEETLSSSGLRKGDVSKVVATGEGKNDVLFADKLVTEPIADARAAKFLLPTAKSVVDAGAAKTRVVTIGKDSNIEEVVLNQKCMGGLGLLLEVIADRLGWDLDEMARAKAGETVVNDGCPVFAELDALEALNKGASREDVAGAVTEAVAVRLHSILYDKVGVSKDATVFIGGLAKNGAAVNALQKRIGANFTIPDDPEYGTALGAAVIAAD
ncbi:MAG: acyl-CoA dehydratase activase [Clostridiales Family XIII bacterium]|jgi:benzoyl-CoA reductase subunit D|nr:acyl-CoA dehydratase activase [Clostridiales Family XIII bacterium]